MSYFIRSCLGFNLILNFGFMVVLDYLCVEIHEFMCIIGTGKKCIQMFTELASAIRDKRQMYFIPLQKFLHDFCEQLFNACVLSLTQQFSLFLITPT